MTIQAQPATIFNDLRKKLASLIDGGVAVTEMEVKRLEREISSLAKADASGAHELRAHLATVSRDFDACDDFYERALKIAVAEDYLDTAVRYMILLRASARGDKLLEVFERFRERLRCNPAAIKTVANLLEEFGCFRSAASLRAEGIRMNVVEAHDVSNLDQAESMTVEEERDLLEPIQFSQAFLRNRGVAADQVEVTSLDLEDGQTSLFYQIWLNRTVDDVAELEWDLFGELSNREFAAHRNRRIVFALTPKALDHAGHC